jgi:hypothetical protein
MPTTYKVLNQQAMSANTYTNLYTVPAATSAVISTITVANTASTTATYRLAVTSSATAASAVALGDHIAYDVNIEANDTTALTIGLTLEAGKKLVGRASTASVAFGVFGSEVT